MTLLFIVLVCSALNVDISRHKSSLRNKLPFFHLFSIVSHLLFRRAFDTIDELLDKQPVVTGGAYPAPLVNSLSDELEI